MLGRTVTSRIDILLNISSKHTQLVFGLWVASIDTSEYSTVLQDSHRVVFLFSS